MPHEIHRAIRGGSLGHVQHIIDMDPSSLNKKNGELGYPLVIALKANKGKIVNDLFQRNLSQNHLNAALMHSISASRLNMVRRLLNKGAKVNTQIRPGSSPLSYAAAAAGQNTSIIRELLNRGALPTRQALVSAITTSRLPSVHVLLNAGAPINQGILNMPMVTSIRNAITTEHRRRRTTAALVGLQSAGLPRNLIRRILS